MKKKVGVLGAGGRMGQEVALALKSATSLDAFLGLDASGEAPGFQNVAKNLQSPLCEQVEIWIDFSSPEGLEKLLEVAKAPVLSGTTGLTENTKTAMARAAKTIPLFWASNMSLGIAVLQEAMKVFRHLDDFDFQIEELHHRRKKDRPSGTAITLQERLEEIVGRECPQPLSIRGGGIFGIHRIWAMSDEEVLTFEHQALNRAVFARGAVKAASWMVGRAPGLYSMRDLFEDSRR